MTDKSISPLRRRFIEDMTVRGFTPATQRGYLRAVADFTAFFGRPPDQAGAEDLRRYQVHMRSQGASATTMNAAVSALRFFFGVTLGRGDAQTGMTTVREPRRLSVILSPEEVARLLNAALYLSPGAASRKRATSSGLSTTGSLRGSWMNVVCSMMSDRLSVTLKKNRNAATV